MDERRMEFIEELALFYEKWGVPRIGGKILGLLLTEVGKLSSEEITSELTVSRGSVSTNLRLLINVGLVNKKAVPGDRIYYYEFSDNAWEQTIKIRMEQMFLPLNKLAVNGMMALDPEHPARNRLEEMAEWSKLAEDYHQLLLDEWRKRRGK